MRHRKASVHLDRNSSARGALLRGIARSMLIHGSVRTTKAKAQAARPFVERLVTKGKLQTLASRRLILSTLHDGPATKKLIEVIGPRFRDRKGGYTRIIPLKIRQGDGAHMVLFQFIDHDHSDASKA